MQVAGARDDPDHAGGEDDRPRRVGAAVGADAGDLAGPQAPERRRGHAPRAARGLQGLVELRRALLHPRPQYGHSVTYGLTSAPHSGFLQTTNRSARDIALDSRHARARSPTDWREDRYPETAMKMRQSLNQLERAFVEETTLERHRRESLRRTAERRTAKRRSERALQAGQGALHRALADAARDRRDRVGRDVPRAVPDPRVAPPALSGAERRTRTGSPLRGSARPASADVQTLVVALALDRDVHLAPVDRHAARRLDADPHLVPHDRENGDLDLVSDHDALVRLPRQDEHGTSLSCRSSGPLSPRAHSECKRATRMRAAPAARSTTTRRLR